MNPRGSVTSSVNSDDDYANSKNTIIIDEKKDEKSHTYSSVNSNQPKPANMSNVKNNTFSSGTSGSTKEEDITQDDLQAMKAMIGDIKKDPSLLYRLSSLAAVEAPSAFNIGAFNNNNTGMNNTFLHSNTLAANSALNKSIEVDDDHTEVSSLGMMSYDESGKNFLNANHQFSPSGANRGQGMKPGETMASRTNRDVEIALRMQSLRAKKGLFNSSLGGSSTVMRVNSAKQLNVPQPHLGRAVSASRNQETNPKPTDDMKIQSKPLSSTPHKNRQRAHTSPSVPFNQEYATKREGNELRKSLENSNPDESSRPIARADHKPSSNEKGKSSGNYKPDRSEEHLERTERKSSVSRQHGLITPDAEQKKPTPVQEKDIFDYNRGQDPDSSDLETPNNDEDDDSQNSALVLYKESLNSKDVTPRNENRKQLSDSLDPETLNGGHIPYTLPFKRQGSDRVMENNPYYSAVSKYADASNGNVRDGKVEQLKRSSSSQSASRHKESYRRTSRSDSTYSESSKTKQLDLSRRRSQSELRPKMEKQRTEQEGAKKVTKSKRAESSSRRRRSTSEDPRKVSNNQYVSLQRGVSEKPSSNGSHPRRTVSSGNNLVLPPPPPRRSLEREPHDLAQGVDNNYEEDRITVHSPKDEEAEENVDRGSSDKASRSRSRLEISPGNELNSSTQPQRDLERSPHGVKRGVRVSNYHENRITIHRPKDEEVDKVSSLHPSFGSFTFGSLSDHSPKEPGLGEKLQKLNLRDKSFHEHEGQSSGRSVISRISHMVKGKASRRGGESMGSHQSAHHDVNSSPRSSDISPKKSIESDDGSVTRSGRKLISRLSHSRLSNVGISSPHQSHKRRTTTVEPMNSSLTPSDWEKTTIRSANGRENPLILNESGDALAMRTELEDRDDMTRLCDEKGRCIWHPHIRLQKPKLFGGWKIIFKHCPDCAVEHMKRTQKELAAQQLKSKRKKHKEKKDHFINEISEINLEEGQEKKHRKHKTKKKHSTCESDGSPNDDHTDFKQPPPKHSEHYRTQKDYYHADPRQNTAVRTDHHSTARDDREFDRQLITTTNNEYHNTPDRPRNTVASIEHHSTLRDDRAVDRQLTTTTNSPKVFDEHPTKLLQNFENNKKTPESEANHSLAIVERKEPKVKKVNGLPWSDYNGQSGRYTGEVNDEYLPHGRGEMVYDRGVVSSGIWYKGVLDSEGPMTQDEYVPERLASYSIGDKGRDEDMIIDSKKETAAAVALLRVSDAAFVRRSDGNWTYAIVKDRTEGSDASIKFKVNARGSTKSFPTSQWGSYIRRIKRQHVDAPAKKGLSLDQFLTNNRSNIGSSNSVAGGNLGLSSDHSIGSARSLPLIDRNRAVNNLTTAKMNIRTRSRSRSRNRKNVTTLPLLFSSSMSVSEENEGNDNDGWETASGSGYRLRGIDP